MAVEYSAFNPDSFTRVQWAFSTIVVIVPIIFATYLYLRPTVVLPNDAPPLLKEDWPIIGTLRFFTGRWDFFSEAIKAYPSFSFYVGQKHVIGVSGDQQRKAFFDNKDLDFNSGYGDLLAGSPSPPQEVGQEDISEGTQISSDDPRWFLTRIQALLKGGIIKRGLPALVSDVKWNMDKLAADPRGITDPFDSIYRIIFQLTMRTLACKEIADQPDLLSQTLKLFEEVEKAGTPTSVMYPWLPTPAKFKRIWGGTQLYLIFKGIMDQRRQHGHPEDDALKFMMESGDNVRSIIQFVLGALFAGQLNSGINAAWVLIYLSQSPEWQSRARAEVESVASQYDSDMSKPLAERLLSIPAEAWETEFPILELCLRDSIRIQMVGAAFRKNISDKPVRLGNEASLVVQPGSCVMYHAGDIHLDPEVYPEPSRWDPGRYLPDRAEDKKRPHGFIGWGVGRHPCPGQRFAKLESNLITAFFMAYFDFEYCDAEGRTTGVKPPPINLNASSAHRPTQKCCLKYMLRDEHVGKDA